MTNTLIFTQLYCGNERNLASQGAIYKPPGATVATIISMCESLPKGGDNKKLMTEFWRATYQPKEKTHVPGLEVGYEYSRRGVPLFQVKNAPGKGLGLFVHDKLSSWKSGGLQYPGHWVAVEHIGNFANSQSKDLYIFQHSRGAWGPRGKQRSLVFVLEPDTVARFINGSEGKKPEEANTLFVEEGLTVMVLPMDDIKGITKVYMRNLLYIHT